MNGKLFDVVKLRSMIVDAESNGEAKWCVTNDARITTVGRILRRLHLDELPQLYNVVKGEMSLVGPRPERPEICEKLAQQIACYYDRNTVKPGITGLAQINLPPDETIDDVRRKQVLDLHYIDQANAWLDARIMILTGLYLIGINGEKLIEMMGLNRKHLIEDRSNVSRSVTDDQYFRNKFELSVTCLDTDENEDAGDALEPDQPIHAIPADRLP